MKPPQDMSDVMRNVITAMALALGVASCAGHPDDLEAFIKRHPEHEAEIRRMYSALEEKKDGQQ